MRVRRNKWKRNEFVQCGSCDYCCIFEGDETYFCANNRKAGMSEIRNISQKRICKCYFPRELNENDEHVSVARGMAKSDSEFYEELEERLLNDN